MHRAEHDHRPGLINCLGKISHLGKTSSIRLLTLALAVVVGSVLFMRFGPGNHDLPDFSGLGPFAVGVTTLRPVSGPVTEVWYPVDRNSVAGLPTEIFDHLSVWPIDIRGQIPHELFPAIDTGAHRDVSPSPQGPFPLVVFSHGFGGYRQMSSFYTTHLATWGYVGARS